MIAMGQSVRFLERHSVCASTETSVLVAQPSGFALSTLITISGRAYVPTCGKADCASSVQSQRYIYAASSGLKTELRLLTTQNTLKVSQARPSLEDLAQIGGVIDSSSNTLITVKSGSVCYNVHCAMRVIIENAVALFRSVVQGIFCSWVADTIALLCKHELTGATLHGGDLWANYGGHCEKNM